MLGVPQVYERSVQTDATGDADAKGPGGPQTRRSYYSTIMMYYNLTYAMICDYIICVVYVCIPLNIILYHIG